MKKNEIEEGVVYRAKVNGKVTRVRVDSIEVRSSIVGRDGTIYRVTNLATGRKTVFRSAVKFLSPDVGPKKLPAKKIEPSVAVAVDPPPVSKSARSAPKPRAKAPAKKSSTETGLAVSLRASREAAGSSPHVIVRARAGTGKTTTIIEGLKYLKGLTTEITPSPQQRAVWEALRESSGANTVCFVAFNRSIADELEKRVPPGCDAINTHRLGFRAVRDAFNLLPGRRGVNEYRTSNILGELNGCDPRQFRADNPVVAKAVERLVSLCKNNLVGYQEEPDWQEEIIRLSVDFEIELGSFVADIVDLVPRVLERSKDIEQDGCIDFDDMIWAPVVLDLPVFRYDLLLIDEAQDLNRSQQALVRKAGKRLVFIGDDRQAIYGFAGADSQSISRMKRELSDEERGCIELPLTVTYRCGKEIVKEAQRYVPDFEAYEDNPEGLVTHESLDWRSYRSHVREGDMVICRINAPLVSQCLRFLKEGRKATIQGRDIGKGLIKLIESFKAESIPDLLASLDKWLRRETDKILALRTPSESRLLAVQDKNDCILAFCEGASSVAEVIDKINAIFADRNSGGIRLSSIHRAKGLEAPRVFFLQPLGGQCPHPKARTATAKEQEINLLYVGITRAIEALHFVVQKKDQTNG